MAKEVAAKSAWEIVVRVDGLTEEEAEHLYASFAGGAAFQHGSDAVRPGDVRPVFIERAADPPESAAGGSLAAPDPQQFFYGPVQL